MCFGFHIYSISSEILLVITHTNVLYEWTIYRIRTFGVVSVLVKRAREGEYVFVCVEIEKGWFRPTFWFYLAFVFYYYLLQSLSIALIRIKLLCMNVCGFATMDRNTRRHPNHRMIHENSWYLFFHSKITITITIANSYFGIKIKSNILIYVFKLLWRWT